MSETVRPKRLPLLGNRNRNLYAIRTLLYAEGERLEAQRELYADGETEEVSNLYSDCCEQLDRLNEAIAALNRLGR